MDYAAIISAVPTAGVSGILLSLIFWLWKGWNGAENRHRQTIADIRQSHDKAIEELRSELRQLRVDLDAERDRRMRAEEAAHQARMGEL